jgi:hypothetical protein
VATMTPSPNARPSRISGSVADGDRIDSVTGLDAVAADRRLRGVVATEDDLERPADVARTLERRTVVEVQ